MSDDAKAALFLYGYFNIPTVLLTLVIGWAESQEADDRRRIWMARYTLLLPLTAPLTLAGWVAWGLWWFASGLPGWLRSLWLTAFPPPELTDKHGPEGGPYR